MARRQKQPAPTEDEIGSNAPGSIKMARIDSKMALKAPQAPVRVPAPWSHVDPAIARERALEWARRSGVLSSLGRIESGAFASLTGSGDYLYDLSNGARDTEPVGDPSESGPSVESPPARNTSARPGSDSVFAGRENDLEACFRKQGTRRVAAFVAEIETDDQGEVRRVEILGWNDKAFDECAAKVAKARRYSPANTSRRQHRCPVAFGPMSIAQSPGIDVLEDTIKVTLDAGKPAELRALKVPPSNAGSDEFELRKVFEPVREAVLLREFGYPTDAITLSGPFYIRPIPEAPMKLVLRVIRLMRMACQESVLAWRDDATWRIVPRSGLPDSIEAPLAPMPYGTGAGASGLSFLVASAHPTRIVLLVASDAIWIGLTSDDYRRLPKQDGRYDWNGLADALRDYKTRPALAETAAIEVAGADDVEYRHLVPALRAASEAGFDEWTLHSPSALSVRFR